MYLPFPLVLCWALVFLQGWSLPISLHVWEMTRWGRPLSSKIRPRFVAVLPSHLGSLSHFLSSSLSSSMSWCAWCRFSSTVPVRCFMHTNPFTQLHLQCHRCHSRSFGYFIHVLVAVNLLETSQKWKCRLFYLWELVLILSDRWFSLGVNSMSMIHCWRSPE